MESDGAAAPRYGLRRPRVQAIEQRSSGLEITCLEALIESVVDRSNEYDRATDIRRDQRPGMQVEIQALCSWIKRPAAWCRRPYQVVSCKPSSDSSYGFDIKVISTIHPSIFANSSAAAGTIR